MHMMVRDTIHSTNKVFAPQSVNFAGRLEDWSATCNARITAQMRIGPLRASVRMRPARLPVRAVQARRAFRISRRTTHPMSKVATNMASGHTNSMGFSIKMRRIVSIPFLSGLVKPAHTRFSQTPSRQNRLHACGGRIVILYVRTHVSLLCLLMAGCVLADGPTAQQLYEQGRKAEKAGHIAQAYIMYSQAAAMEPNNQTYWLRSQAVSSRAALEAKPMPQEAAEQAAYTATPTTRRRRFWKLPRPRTGWTRASRSLHRN